MAPYRDEFEPPKARNDAYTGLLAISFFAMLIAALLLVVDWYTYQDFAPPRVKDKLPPVPKIGAVGAPAVPPKDVGKPPDKGKPPEPPPMPDKKPMPPNGKDPKDMKKPEEMKKDEK